MWPLLNRCLVVVGTCCCEWLSSVGCSSRAAGEATFVKSFLAGMRFYRLGHSLPRCKHLAPVLSSAWFCACELIALSLFLLCLWLGGVVDGLEHHPGWQVPEPLWGVLVHPVLCAAKKNESCACRCRDTWCHRNAPSLGRGKPTMITGLIVCKIEARGGTRGRQILSSTVVYAQTTDTDTQYWSRWWCGTGLDCIG